MEQILFRIFVYDSIIGQHFVSSFKWCIHCCWFVKRIQENDTFKYLSSDFGP